MIKKTQRGDFAGLLKLADGDLQGTIGLGNRTKRQKNLENQEPEHSFSWSCMRGRDGKTFFGFAPVPKAFSEQGIFRKSIV